MNLIHMSLSRGPTSKLCINSIQIYTAHIQIPKILEYMALI